MRQERAYRLTERGFLIAMPFIGGNLNPDLALLVPLAVSFHMTKTEKLLDRMRKNPKGDWTIADVEKLCRAHGVDFDAPSNGSHFKVTAKGGVLSVPARRPIKPVYITALVALLDAQVQND